MSFFTKPVYRVKDSFYKGFTLIELSVVILIFGISLMFITPTLVKKFSGADPLAEGFNEIISITYEKSRELNKPLFIKGNKGGNTLKTEFKTAVINSISSFSTVNVNGNIQPGGDFYIGIYPEGFMDSFEILTDTGIKIISRLNSLKVKVE